MFQSRRHRGIRTLVIVAHLHRSWADAKEEHTVFLVLCAELGHNDVQGRLRGSVYSSWLNLVIVDPLKIAMTAGNGDNFLNLALHNKRVEEFEEMNVAGDIGFKLFRCNIVQLLVLVGPSKYIALKTDQHKQ